jgi:hypothetical protein
MPVPQKPRDTTFKSRAVKNMLPDQLQRKRESDREGQRIKRQKTRDHIKNLEWQVDDKEQQLKEALLRNYELEGQVATLQGYIAEMTGVFQYWQSYGVGGRTGSWHSAPTASSNTRDINWT